MLLTWWRKLTDSRLQGAKRLHRVPALSQPFRWLQVERLEDRSLMSVNFQALGYLGDTSVGGPPTLIPSGRTGG